MPSPRDLLFRRLYLPEATMPSASYHHPPVDELCVCVPPHAHPHRHHPLRPPPASPPPPPPPTPTIHHLSYRTSTTPDCIFIISHLYAGRLSPLIVTHDTVEVNGGPSAGNSPKCRRRTQASFEAALLNSGVLFLELLKEKLTL
ncbi:unnamed protein product [Nippostrongylus brasiliensis]|uniref:Uncharacterized protein n=1 Tax=Nippostrongylus brasiliensis TaxID=27835 RepID=A0A0N4Y525_NIPBR|nr:unnamed protein product [Nippostrongylus brasiliensis]